MRTSADDVRPQPHAPPPAHGHAHDAHPPSAFRSQRVLSAPLAWVQEGLQACDQAEGSSNKQMREDDRLQEEEGQEEEEEKQTIVTPK